MNWPLHEAKERLIELVKAAEYDGPQMISVDGQEAAVVLSIGFYRQFTARSETLLDFFQYSPLCGVSIDISRNEPERNSAPTESEHPCSRR